MRLYEFIDENMEAVLEEWESFARENQPFGEDMNTIELRDHAKEMLNSIVRDMETAQTEQERKRKSQGNSRPSHSNAITAAEKHAHQRLGAGFSISLLVAEYRALRASVLRLWFRDKTAHQREDTEELEDMVRFNEAIDQALAESVSHYTDSVTENSDIFVGMLGHDLRSPLQVLSFGAAKLKNMEDAGNSLNQLGSTMIASVQRMKEMLDNLMDFTESRIGKGLSIRLAPTDLADIAHQLIAEFRSANQDHTFQQVVTGNCTGNWDASRIGQICQNLISNAVQHGAPDGEIVVGCEGRDDSVILTVRSEGRAIPESEQKEIFKISSRKHNEKGNPNKNLGLGLYIVKELARAHDGEASVESTQNGGTIFKVELPRGADVQLGLQ